MFQVFSGWKFYTKERSLLKKYLVEFGQSQVDMSLMTTIEMRDKADRYGNRLNESSE